MELPERISFDLTAFDLLKRFRVGGVAISPLADAVSGGQAPGGCRHRVRGGSSADRLGEILVFSQFLECVGFEGLLLSDKESVNEARLHPDFDPVPGTFYCDRFEGGTPG